MTTEIKLKNSKRNISIEYGFDKKEDTKQQEQQELLLILGNDTMFVEADKGRIAQVIDNLISYALKFTYEGTIFVSVESKDGLAIVSVKDNGQGIDPEKLPKAIYKFASSQKQEVQVWVCLFPKTLQRPMAEK